jgi:hypothetical protein
MYCAASETANPTNVRTTPRTVGGIRLKASTPPSTATGTPRADARPASQKICITGRITAGPEPKITNGLRLTLTITRKRMIFDLDGLSKVRFLFSRYQVRRCNASADRDERLVTADIRDSPDGHRRLGDPSAIIAGDDPVSARRERPRKGRLRRGGPDDPAADLPLD